jgi:hypothetical protein
MEGYGSSDDSSGEEPWRGGGREGRGGEPAGSSRGRLAFVVYKNASHASDLHGENLGNANEPPEWKRQRAEALATAVAFAQEFRQGMLQEAGGEPLLSQ